MKALNLKSMSWIMALAMMFIVSFTSCSDSDDNTNTTPVFPELKSISCNAGETKEFTFDANLDWKLTSTAIWCKFEKDGTDEVALSGSAGKQTVVIKVTDGDQKPGEASVAKLELAMGGEKAFVAEVTRSALGYELKIYDAEGNEIKQLELGYQTFISFKVKANFRFAASDFPEWVALKDGSLVGVANKEVEGGLKIVEDEMREKFPIIASDANVITFSDEAGKASFSFPVFYKGMTPGKIDVKAPTNTRYNWTVSLDGKTFTQGDGTTGNAVTTIQNQMPFTIITAEDKYEIVFLEKTGRNTMILMDQANKWMHCKGNDGNVNLTIDALTGKTERTGYVVALTKDEYESIKDDLINALTQTSTDGIDIAYEYQQTNLMVQFIQKKSESTDGQVFNAKFGVSQTSIECKLYEGEKLEEYKSKYAVNTVSEMQVPEELAIIAAVPFNIESVEGYNVTDESAAPNGFTSQSGEKEFDIDPSKANGEDIFIVVKGLTASDAAMLIVKAYKDDGTQKFIVLGGSTPTIYMGDNAASLKSSHSLTELYKTTATAESMNIKMNPSAIKTFEVYDLTNGVGNENVADDVIDDIHWGYNDMMEEEIGKIMVDYGSWSQISAQTHLIVVTCEDDSVYGIVVSKGN